MWIRLPSTFYPSAPEPGDSTSACEWRSRLLESSAALSGKATTARSWIAACKKKPWMTRLFGRILEPSMAARGVESWIASLQATRAHPSARPVNGVGRMIPVISGLKLPASSESVSPDLFSSKTSLATSLSVLTKSPGTWSRWGTELRLEYSLRTKSAPPIKGRDSSSWLTPCGMTGIDKTGKAGAGGELFMQATRWQTPATDSFRPRGGDRKDEMGLDQQVRRWPTATAKDGDSAGNRSSQNCHPGTSLHDATKHWPTPNTAPESKQLGSNQISSPPSLGEAAKKWPTPRTVTGGGESAERKKQLGREDAGGGDLQAAVENWPTPGANDMKGSHREGQRHGQLDEAAEIKFQSSLLAQGTGDGATSSEKHPTSRRRLNPAFVAWLMGWPWWWTHPAEINCARSGMESHLSKLRTHLFSLLKRLC